MAILDFVMREQYHNDHNNKLFEKTVRRSIVYLPKCFPRGKNVSTIKSYCRRNDGMVRLLRFTAKLLQRFPVCRDFREENDRNRGALLRGENAGELAETMPR